MRILGLDFGDKTIGVAVSDPFGWTAQGVEIIRRENSMEFKKCMRRLAELVEQYQAETIVLGYPKNLYVTSSVLMETSFRMMASVSSSSINSVSTTKR